MTQHFGFFHDDEVDRRWDEMQAARDQAEHEAAADRLVDAGYEGPIPSQVADVEALIERQEEKR